MRAFPLLLTALCLLLPATSLRAEPTEKKATPETLSVEELAKKARQSVMVFRVGGRDRRRGGVGTGFVISKDGLIATNMHVIGQGREITVETAGGKTLPVKSIHAHDHKRDLAIVRVDAHDLVPLALGASNALVDGQSVVAMGNPQGLEHSVVAGVVSGKREIDGRTMVQLAIPVEPGNSGGPVLDRQGRVVGILSIKSLVTENLGFAVAIEDLKPLLARPNPVPYTAWRTIGVLDPDQWEPRLGSHWQQRAGRILVEEPGSGFGGRSFCLSKQKVPDLPYEVGVAVRLDDERGAAGLIFHADGGDKHYGFYPTGGKLRLTRFAGPDVFSWTILHDEKSPYYRPGEWNHLKVRLEKDAIHCYVNDHLVFRVADTTWTSGQAGLAKFRTTEAEFRSFRIAKHVPGWNPPADVRARVRKSLDAFVTDSKPTRKLLNNLTGEGPASLKVLREQARELERRAEQLRQLARKVHQEQVLGQLHQVAGEKKDDEIDLVHAALLIALLDNEEVDVDYYRQEVEHLARKVGEKLGDKASDRDKVAVLNTYLFQERGFHGSREEYYNRENSYLSSVIDDREGLPITLSVLYLAVGHKLGLKMEGVGLPGHFVVRFVPSEGEPQLIDVYEGGKILDRAAAARKVLALSGQRLRDEDLQAVSARAILVRMLFNLFNVAQREKDPEGMLRYLGGIVAVAPHEAEARAMRAGLRMQQGNRPGAIEDMDWLLDNKPAGIDLDRVREFRDRLSREKRD
jgi:serine protease Do